MNLLNKGIFLTMIFVLILSLFACKGSGNILSVGDQAPNFELPTTDGSIISLSDFYGQPVLLYFHMAMG